jgi:hypothetical protein
MPKVGRHAHRRRRRAHRVVRRPKPTTITTRCASCDAEAVWAYYIDAWVPLGADPICNHMRDHYRVVFRIDGGALEAEFGTVQGTRA